jgi:putative peptide zinc metalloprotease protein
VKVPKLQLTRRTSAVAAITAVVVTLGGWAFAEGGVPIVSSGTDATTTSTTPAAPSDTTASPGSGTDNVAAAVNTKDGKTVVAISLKITQIANDTVDPTNAAVAVASCSDCQTVAIALEGVLVAGDPTTFDPTNIALALNTGCTNCQTLATAYQDVVQNSTRVRITGAGRQEIADVRKDLESLRNSGLDIAAIQQRVDNDAGRLLAVLRNDVVPIGKPGTTTTTAPAVAATQAPDTTAPPSSTSTTAPTSSTTTPTTAPATTPTSTSVP